MSDRVKRHYASPVRDQQARATRRSVVEAAATLFTADGWAATSIDRIAAEAGVARATVFVVGGKVELLKLAYDAAIGGDLEPVPLAERPSVERMQRETDADVVLGLYADLVVEIAARVGGLYVALRSAADADPRTRDLFAQVQQERVRGAAGLVGSLRERGMLRRDLDLAAAADVVWVLNDPGLHHGLVVQRGWSPHRFRTWLHAALRTQLLPA